MSVSDRLAGQATFEGLTAAQLRALTVREWDELAWRAGIPHLPTTLERAGAVIVLQDVEDAHQLFREV